MKVSHKVLLAAAFILVGVAFSDKIRGLPGGSRIPRF